ncbi:FtsX-like permease family protein [Nonomuraea sp. PA05]|uniref:FtsX-like permease family protein n=1 Tax=Nonomuraea sp. PA05 TaxID=2604466 RepID=UPI0011D9DA02|nr:FtsX-like permease family protein [Nonomuraea sp. PA05]TYB70273.1 FtsX-like permease family protein [Nonomuraea sp. PA05]
MPDIGFLLFFVALYGVPVMLTCCATVLAALAAPRGRHGGVRASFLSRGASVAGMGLVGMAIAAWNTSEDGTYDDFGSAMTELAAVYSAAVFLLGLGPAVPWLLGVLGRLPRPFRAAARHLADDRARTSPAVATTMVATAVTVALAIVAHAQTAQSRANHEPLAQPGALVVNFDPEQAAAAEAAVRQELPGVPLARGYEVGSTGHLDVSDSEDTAYIGDRALLRYLTGNPSAPHDPRTAVVVTADPQPGHTVQLRHGLTGPDDSKTRSIQAATAGPVAGGLERVFVPMEFVQGLGLRLDVVALIVDPVLHRASEADRDRIAARLGDDAGVYLEQGYRGTDNWRYLAGVVAFIAVAGALVATARSHRPRVLRRIGSPRLLTACRAALAAACGTVPGVVAGCVAGLLLAWPATTTAGWEVVPRVPFETPWALIGLLTVAVPVLAALAGLSPGAGRTSAR